MLENSYSTRLKEYRLMYNEFNALFEFSEDNDLKGRELLNYCYANNFFHQRTEKRNRIISSLTLNRISVMDDDLKYIFKNTDIQTKRFIVLYTMIKTDLLFSDFFNEKVRIHFLNNQLKISNYELEEYMEYKSEQSEKINSWKTSTKIQIYKGFRTTLVDCGVASRFGHAIILQRPIIDRLLVDYFIKKNDYLILESIGG